MFENYLKTTLRNIRKQKIYSLINITGLAIGMACCILIFLYIRFEFSFDKFHDNAENIYRPVVGNFSGTPYILGEQVLKEIPEVSSLVRFKSVGTFEEPIFSYEDKLFIEEDFYITDPSFFDIFSFSLLYGDPKTALSSPNSLVLTKDISDKYFGDTDPTGNVLTYENRLRFIVTGVLDNLPPNTHFDFKILASTDANEIIKKQDRSDRATWSSSNYRTYMLLNPNANPDVVKEKIENLIQKNRPSLLKESSLDLQRLTDIHLHSNLRGEFKETGNLSEIYFYTAIGLIILIISCINYINLASANSLKRSVEVGVRKVLGAARIQLIKQFICESIIMAAMALPISLLIVISIERVMSELTGISVSLIGFISADDILFVIIIVILIGLFAGFYPAFLSSSYNPVKAIKNEKLSRGKRFSTRNVLLIVQFAASIFFVCCTFFVSAQLEFLRNKELKLKTDRILVVPINKEVCKKSDLIKTELLSDPFIESISASDFLMSNNNTIYMGCSWEDKTDIDPDHIRYLFVDPDFLKTFDINLISGRNFNVDVLTDQGDAYILNETAVNMIGWKNPVGKRFKIDGPDRQYGEVIGVVEDFNFRSLYNAIEPVVLYFPEGHPRWSFVSEINYSIVINGGNIPDVINHIGSIIDKHVPNQPFEYFFLDEDIDKIYREEMFMAKFFKSFSLISIVLSCLGIFGLSMFVIETRIKEIGIRKVFGASITYIFYSLSTYFIRWILLANLIAWPLAFYVIDKWLGKFAYSIDISVFTFVLGGILVLLISLLSISYHCIKAAIANPIDSLRYE
jgi:putative ABC transport system permease protein